MTHSFSHIVWGDIPLALHTAHTEAVQVSPLVPQSPALEDCAPESLQSATLYAPHSTIERRYVFALALRALAVGAPLVAMAPNDKGGTRMAKELRALGCDVYDESRSHHRICHTKRPANLMAIEEALAAGAPQQHPAHGLWTQAGVFGWDKVDVGSALLLEHVPSFQGHGGDLGCGIGVLSHKALTSDAVKSIALLDIDRRAIHAAKQNITDTRASFIWADIRHTLPTLQPLDFVVMNPPFHDTGVEDQSLGQHFIKQAASLLKDGGQCWMTANRHLPYEAPLKTLFRNVERVAEANGFKIIYAEK